MDGALIYYYRLSIVSFVSLSLPRYISCLGVVAAVATVATVATVARLAILAQSLLYVEKNALSGLDSRPIEPLLLRTGYRRARWAP